MDETGILPCAHEVVGMNTSKSANSAATVFLLKGKPSFLVNIPPDRESVAIEVLDEDGVRQYRQSRRQSRRQSGQESAKKSEAEE